MYCSNCQCDSCKAQRAAIQIGEGDLAAEAMRVIAKSGSTGRTLSELGKYSRHLRFIPSSSLAQLIDALEMSGAISKQTFRQAVRGKARHAYVANEISQ